MAVTIELPVDKASVRLYDTSEWFDNEAVPQAGGIKLPEPDDDYIYVSCRLLSFFPVVNLRGATYEKEDFDEGLLSTLLGKQANLEHDKSKVVGSIFAYDVTDDGIDIGIRVDREQADIHGMDPEEMKQDKYFSHVSVELSKDPELNTFYAYDPDFSIARKIPVVQGRELGIRRTVSNDPYLLQGRRVAERIKPLRFTGVGFVPRPADQTAQIYAVAASDTSDERLKRTETAKITKEPYGDVHYADPGFQSDGKSRYPLDTPEHVRSAASYFGMPKNRDKYTEEQRKHIDAAIAEAKKTHGIGDSEESSAYAGTEENRMTDEEIKALQEKVGELETQVKSLRTEKEAASALETENAAKINELQTKIATLETELASAVTERDALKSEKEIAARDARVETLMKEMEAIHPFEDDDDRTDTHDKVKASLDNYDDGRSYESLKMQRENKSLKAKLAAHEKEKADAAAAAAGTPSNREVTKETFSAETPGQKLTPVYEGDKPVAKPNKLTSEETLAAF